jgi:hypothetical protein
LSELSYTHFTEKTGDTIMAAKKKAAKKAPKKKAAKKKAKKK